MKRNVVLSRYNRATYLDQTQAIMYEKRVAKSFICACNLSRLKTLHVCGHMSVQLHTSPERACMTIFSEKNTE